MSTTEMRRPLARAVTLAAVCMLAVACDGGGHSKNTPPTASFTATPASGVSPQPVALDASASLDREGPIAAYSWNFGDGSATATGVTTTHVYRAPGSFTVTLTVTDRKGLTGTTSSTITVKANTPPTASFTVTPTRGLAPLAVAVDASGSSDLDGSILTYEWIYGDGGSGTGVVTQHTYVTSDRFQVTLKVTDDRGGVGTSTASLVIMSGTAAEWYSVTVIPARGGSCVSAVSLNNVAAVTGQLNYYGPSAPPQHAFLFDGQNLRDLGTLGGKESSGFDVNDEGDVVGDSQEASGLPRAFLARKGTMQDLGTLGGPLAHARGINNAGHVVGYSTDRPFTYRAFLYANGEMRSLGTLGGGSSWAYAINGNGAVAGISETGKPGEQHAFIYSHGVMTELGETDVGAVRGINDANDVIGVGMLNGTLSTGFLYRAGAMQALVNSDPYGINNAGVVVGAAQFDSNWRAFIWDPAKGLQDLNDLIDPALGWNLREARDINDVGQIVAVDYGSYSLCRRAVLLTPAVKP